jgi:lipoate-protein ligase A
MTSLRQELGRNVSAGEVEQALLKGFEAALHVSLEASKASEPEQEAARLLAREKYASEDWTGRT